MEQEIKSTPQQKDIRTATEFWDTRTPTSSFNQYVESDCAVADPAPASFFVCTPSGNIKCPEGFVPSQPSHKITKKMLTDGKCQLLMRAFMTRRSGDIPVEPREPEMLFEDSQSFISTEYGEVYIPDGYKCTNCGITENEEGNSLIVEIRLQLQKLLHHS